MLTHDQFLQICSHTRQYLTDTAAGSERAWVKSFPRAADHRWQHTLNVLRNADEILAGEGAAPEVRDIVRVAVILHDISMFVCDHEIHGRVSGEIAGKYLREEDYPEEFVTRVARAVTEHGMDLDLVSPGEMEKTFSWEGRVVLEADILDKLGASTIVDHMLTLGKEDLLGFECKRELAEGRAMQRAVYFKEYILTETGRRMAAQRFDFFLKFLDQLGQEISDTSLPA